LKKFIIARLAGNILIIILVLLAIFHVLILFKFVPSGIVWGGQIKDSSTNLVTLELVSLIVTVTFLFIIAAKIGYINVGKFKKIINIGVWIIFGYFVLNTFGNLASGVAAENLVFAPITLLLAILAFRLATEK